MATLQSSGAISLANLQTTMGGANPISMSEYYLNGVYVPSSKSITVTEGPFVSDNSPGGPYGVFEGGNQYARWNSVTVSTSYNIVNSWTNGIYTYYKGALNYSYYTAGGYGSSGYWTYWYAISRTYASTTTINAGIPTSGTLSMNQFYGGEKP